MKKRRSQIVHCLGNYGILLSVLVDILGWIASAQASLQSPAVVNGSFEDNLLLPGQKTYTFIGWYDSQGWVEYSTGPAGNGLPLAPGGNQWCGLPGNGQSTNRGYLYQQIGVWDGRENIEIAVLIGKRLGINTCPLRISVWVGGNLALKGNDVALSTVGATRADSKTIVPDFGGDSVGVRDYQVALQTSTGFTAGSPIWIEFKSDGVSAESQLYIDSIRISSMSRANNPQPGNQAIHVSVDTMLSWLSPEISGASCVLYFGTHPDRASNPRYEDAHAPFDPGMLEYDTTYTWRVDTIVGDVVNQGPDWSFKTGGKSTDPVPLDGGLVAAASTVDLSWQADPWATSFKVYAGTGFPLTYQGEVSQAGFAGLPIRKENSTYSWRVDEYVNGQITTEGTVWSFTVGRRLDSCPPGDLTGDCSIGLADLLLLAQQWLEPGDCIRQQTHCADTAGGPGVDLEDLALTAENWKRDGAATIVINEIHYNPDVETELIEFVELHNPGPKETDLSGWRFSNGIEFTFPPGTILAAGDYLVVTENPLVAVQPVTLTSKYGTSSKKIYGPFAGHLRNDGETITLSDPAGHEMDRVNYKLDFPWPTVGDPIPAGTVGTGRSIQLVQPYLDNDLGGSWRSAYPTPGAANTAVLATAIPPHIRQVTHEPEQPTSGSPVTITAKVTDADGIQSVLLRYQVVNPGLYIPIRFPSLSSNPAYENAANWTSIAMMDDGLNGDLSAGDSIFTVRIPSTVQTHRRLVRYRIICRDTAGNEVTVPYADDPQPNFAYFAYDGIPAWKGAIQPGSSDPTRAEVVTYDKEVMRSIPAYHLIARESDVLDCQYNSGYNDKIFHFVGTVVFDGKVYDHIQFRIRGQWSTYESGKNKWKIRFNRGHAFSARDNYGDKYGDDWQILDLSPCMAAWWPNLLRGESGMTEATSFFLFNKAGVPASATHWLQFRIIDAATETHPTNQYDGDFWGLYMAVEQPDGRFLDRNGLPDGNLYKVSSSTGNERTNQGPTQIKDYSDLNWFIGGNGYNKTSPIQPESWWSEKINLDCYYSYRALNAAINNCDLRDQENCLYYHNPLTGQWWMLPWDLDFTWPDEPHYLDWEHFKWALNYSSYNIASKNRGREIRDLLLSGDQLGQLIDELASIIHPGSRPSLVEANRALWDYHPRTTNKGQFFTNPHLTSHDFAGWVQYMKDFASPSGYGGQALDAQNADPDIPATPKVSYSGPADFPANALTFTTTSFQDPQGAGTFAALKWRIAEVEPSTETVVPEPETIILIGYDDIWRYFEGSREPSYPITDWRKLDFEDNPQTTNWQEGALPIGYGVTVNTTLSDMRDAYTSVYLRKEFEVADPALVDSLTLSIHYDEGFNLWINGTRVAFENVPGENIACTETALSYVSGQTSTMRVLQKPLPWLVAGTNVVAVQVLNYQASSSDLLFSLELKAAFDSFQPTPSAGRNQGKYEIDAIWESDDLTNPTDLSVSIPAGQLKSGKTYRVRSRMKDTTGRWSHWSDPVQFTAGEPLSAGTLDNLRITELMYNPAPPDNRKGEMNVDNDEFEFVELKNIGDEAIGLSYVSFTEGITFDLSSGRIKTLGPGEFLLLVKNQAAFESRYGAGLSARITEQFIGQFANGGERVVLRDFWNGIIAEFEYGDRGVWPAASDGAGHSIVPIDEAISGQPQGSAGCGGNWRASSYRNGSPGADDPQPVAGVVINEITAHTDYTDPDYPGYDSNDWIELYNPSATEIPLNGDWYLSDDLDDLKKWPLPVMSLPSQGRIIFDEITGFHYPLTTGFGLDKAGEQVILSYLPGTAQDRIADAVRFDGQENGTSRGRYPDGGAYWFAMPPTRDKENEHPNQDLRITEVSYHPLETVSKEEYIELQNPTAQAIVLSNPTGSWRLQGGVDFTFPSSLSLAPGRLLLIVAFDPAVETSRLTAFQAAYGTGVLTPGVDIVGPWSGSLSNSADDLAIQRPQAPDLAGDPISWVTVDEMAYADSWPWSAEADGRGESLHRVSTVEVAAGLDPANWVALPPTPGR